MTQQYTDAPARRIIPPLDATRSTEGPTDWSPPSMGTRVVVRKSAHNDDQIFFSCSKFCDHQIAALVVIC